MCLLRTHSFSDSESDWTSSPSRLSFFKKVFIYVFVRGLIAAWGTVSCRRDPPGEGSDWPPASGGSESQPLGPAGKAPPSPSFPRWFPWYLLSFIASADKTNLQLVSFCLWDLSFPNLGHGPLLWKRSLNYWTSGKSLLVLKLWPIIPWAGCVFKVQWVPEFLLCLLTFFKKNSECPLWIPVMPQASLSTQSGNHSHNLFNSGKAAWK